MATRLLATGNMHAINIYKKNLLIKWPALYTTATNKKMFLKKIRGPFAKFVDSPYYSESEICGGAGDASFSWLEKPRNRMGRDLDCMADVLMGFHRSTFPNRKQNSIQISLHAISGLFQPWKGSSEARNFEVINGLQHVFEKWVERCKKCIACQGRYFEKQIVTAPPPSSDWE
jgi:hypothetical protein